MHVFDVARAIVHAARKMTPADGALLILNLADKGDTDAGKITALLGQVFGIPTGGCRCRCCSMRCVALMVTMSYAWPVLLGWLFDVADHSVQLAPPAVAAALLSSFSPIDQSTPVAAVHQVHLTFVSLPICTYAAAGFMGSVKSNIANLKLDAGAWFGATIFDL